MSWTYTSNNYDGRTISLTISETVNSGSNSSTLNWTLTSAGGSVNYYAAGETTVTINGVQVYHKGKTLWDDKVFPAAKGSVSGSLTIVHNADGTKTGVPVSFTTRVYAYTPVEYAGTNINLTNITTYTLSVSAGTGSSISVNRTSSGYASTGIISNGTRLYYGDKLIITFSPSTNYAISTHTVNSSSFTSGGTHTVTGNVSIVSTAQVLASSVGATNANIGSVSTVTVTKYNSAYYHSLQYSFGGLTGYITNSGGVSSSEVKFSNASVAFTIPTSFYSKIPNAKTGTCTITCRTYSSSSSTTVLGNATSCSITITATGAPTVSGSVVDTNATTIALTGNSSILVRYKSTAEATISATANNYSSISYKYINDVAPTNNKRTFSSVSTASFVFKAIDSRGYQSSVTVSPTIVNYIQLTINPIISRPTPTGNTMTISFSGDVYRGSFGAATNTLTIRYRYKESGGSYCSWSTIASTSVVFGTKTYQSSGTITLPDAFNYQKEYEFQVQAYDGISGTTLSTVTKTIVVPRGIPVFDWGENDFNFHVPIKIGDTQLTEAQLIRLLALLN